MKKIQNFIATAFVMACGIYANATNTDTLWVRKGHPLGNGVNSVTFTKDGTKILSGSDCDVARARLYDVNTGNTTWEFLDSTLQCFMDVKFSPNGKYFSIMEEIGNLIIFDYSSSTPSKIATIDTKSKASIALAFTPDNSSVVTAGLDDSIRVFSIISPKQTFAFGPHKNIHSICISQDGTKVCTGGEDGKVKVWNLSNGQLLNTINAHSATVNSIKFSPDGNYLISASADQMVHVWNVSTWGMLTMLMGHNDEVTSVDISSDQKYIITASNDSTIILWNWGTWSQRATLGLKDIGGYRSVAFSPDSKKIVAGSSDGNVILWDLSKITGINQIDHKMNDIVVYPNPAKDYFNIEIDLNEKSQIEIQLHDITGQLISSSLNPVLGRGKALVKWDISTNKNGMYFLTIKTENNCVTKLIQITN
jgi:WD40 repeat protein